jgi:hypothetical protein
MQMNPLDPVALLELGEVAVPNNLARVSQARIDGGPGDGMRVVDVEMVGGFSVRILPDRGLDISSAWAYGIPIGWMSKVGEVRPLDRANGNAWIERFTGGLLTTCGPENVGLANVDENESLGLHGSWSFLSASEVSVRRRVENNQLITEVSGLLRQTHALGRCIEVRRTITLGSGSASVSVVDEICNRGRTPEPIPMLYHVNIGAPFWGPGATIAYPSGTTLEPRNDYARTRMNVAGVGPVAEPGGEEYVFERVVAGGDDDPVIVASPRTGLTLSMNWSRTSLPRFQQWIHPAAGVYALGIEPTNSSLAGRATDRAAGVMPSIEPGETRRFEIAISVYPTAPN